MVATHAAAKAKFAKSPNVPVRKAKSLFVRPMRRVVKFAIAKAQFVHWHCRCAIASPDKSESTSRISKVAMLANAKVRLVQSLIARQSALSRRNLSTGRTVGSVRLVLARGRSVPKRHAIASWARNLRLKRMHMVARLVVVLAHLAPNLVGASNAPKHRS